MASPSKQTETVRKSKRSKRGNVRKARLRNQGSTRSHKELFGDEE